jgi:hypothetical protein
MTAAQKKKRFRELANKDDRIRTGRELLSEQAAPYLPLFNECPDVQRRIEGRPAWSVRRNWKP